MVKRAEGTDRSAPVHFKREKEGREGVATKKVNLITCVIAAPLNDALKSSIVHC